MKLHSKISQFLFNKLSAWFEAQRIHQIKSSMHLCGENVKIYQPVVFYGAEALDIGNNTSVAPYVHIWCGGRVIIGARCMIGSHVAITSLTHNYKDSQMWKTIEEKSVVIKDDVWIGSHAVIMPGVTIENGAVIGAGSVVSKDIAENAIVYGIPATVQSYRNQG